MPATVSSRILMLVENNTYANDTRVRQEAEALAGAGHRVSVICPGSPGTPFRQTLNDVHVYSYRQPRSGRNLAGYLWEYGYSMAVTLFLVIWLLLREGFDIIHAANPPDTFVLVAAPLKLLGKRFIYDHHDLAPELYGARFSTEPSHLVTATLITLERWSCRLADHVIVTNASYQRLAHERGRAPEEAITIVRNGPDLSVLREVAPEPSVVRPGKTVLGYLGSMGYHDGVDYLLRSLHSLHRDLGRDDFHCVLVGAGDALPELRALVAGLGLRKLVTFAGWQSHAEVSRYLSAASICLAPEPSNPYNDRCTAIKVMEYMALGKPIVAFDLPEHRVSAGGAALYARPNSEADFALKIATLMDDPEARERMGKIGQERVRGRLAWQHQIPHLLTVYESLAVD